MEQATFTQHELAVINRALGVALKEAELDATWSNVIYYRKKEITLERIIRKVAKLRNEREVGE